MSKGRNALPLLATAVVAAIASGLSACGGDGVTSTAAAAAAKPSQQILVTREHGDFAPSCDPRQIGLRLRGLSDALVAVDTDALRDYWGPGFRWFRILRAHGDSWFDAESYDEGLAQLRRKDGLHLRFRTVEVGSSGGAAFIARLRPDGGKRKRIGGKLELSCERPSLTVLSGFRYRGTKIAECPKPSGDVPRSAMIVCSRSRS